MQEPCFTPNGGSLTLALRSSRSKQIRVHPQALLKTQPHPSYVSWKLSLREDGFKFEAISTPRVAMALLLPVGTQGVPGSG